MHCTAKDTQVAFANIKCTQHKQQQQKPNKQNNKEELTRSYRNSKLVTLVLRTATQKQQRADAKQTINTVQHYS